MVNNEFNSAFDVVKSTRKGSNSDKVQIFFRENKSCRLKVKKKQKNERNYCLDIYRSLGFSLRLLISI